MTDQLHVKEEYLQSFELPSTRGHPLGPRVFWQRKHLLLLFLHQTACPVCRVVLDKIVDSYPTITSLNADVLVIVGDQKQEEKEGLDRTELPFSLLYDRDNSVSGRYVESRGHYRPAMVVADRYGVVWSRFGAPFEDGSIDVDKALRRLEFIALQCPECDVPDSPPVG